jgi:hypothetical protein
MIAFFRRLRQKLLTENKFSKYLLYAIGEIALVVIGILIALNINNANEYKKERAQEQLVLRQLRGEFQDNMEQLDQKIAMRVGMMKSAKQLLDLIDHPDLRTKDSVDILIARTLPYTTFDPIINDLNSSGEMRLLENPALKQALTRWSSNVKDVMEEEEIWKYYRNEIYMPFLIEHYQFRTLRDKAMKSNVLGDYSLDITASKALYSADIGSSNHEEDFNALLDHPDLEDHLSRCFSVNNWSNVQAIILKSRIEKILELIDSEID